MSVCVLSVGDVERPVCAFVSTGTRDTCHNNQIYTCELSNRARCTFRAQFFFDKFSNGKYSRCGNFQAVPNTTEYILNKSRKLPISPLLRSSGRTADSWFIDFIKSVRVTFRDELHVANTIVSCSLEAVVSEW